MQGILKLFSWNSEKLVVLILLGTLTACGGSGGTEGSTSNLNAAPVQPVQPVPEVNEEQADPAPSEDNDQLVSPDPIDQAAEQPVPAPAPAPIAPSSPNAPSQPAPAPVVSPAPQPEPAPAPAPQPKPEPQPEPELEPTPAPEPQPEPAPQPVVPEPVPEPEAEEATLTVSTAQPQVFKLGNAVAPIAGDMTAWMLNDLMKTAGFTAGQMGDSDIMWLATKQGIWLPDQTQNIVVDANGWPKSMRLADNTFADSFLTQVMRSQTQNAYESGIYILRYEGTGTLRLTNADMLESKAGEMTIFYNGLEALQIEIIATDLAGNGNHLRNMRLFRPNAVEDQRFNPTYLSDIKDFSVIRPLALMGDNQLYGFPDENGSFAAFKGQTGWASRTKLSDANWAGAKGAPFEVIADLANKSDSDLWLNLPVAADDAYLRQLAQLMLSNLSEDRVLYLELGNELWNLTYPYAIGRDYAYNEALKRWPNVAVGQTKGYLLEKVSEDTLVLSWQAARTLEAAAIFKEVWGAQATRISVVLAGEMGASKTAKSRNRLLLEAPLYVNEENGVVPATQIDAFAIGATIVDPGQEGEEEVDGGFDRSSAEAFITDAIDYVDGTGRFGENTAVTGMRYKIRADASLAEEYGLAMVAYAGGHHFIGSTFTRDEVSVNDDMSSLYQVLFDMWREENGGLFINSHDTMARGYNDPCATPSLMQSANFGLKETQLQTEADAPLLRAVVDIMQALGQTS